MENSSSGDGNAVNGAGNNIRATNVVDWLAGQHQTMIDNDGRSRTKFGDQDEFRGHVERPWPDGLPYDDMFDEGKDDNLGVTTKFRRPVQIPVAPLDSRETELYKRQMIVPGVGLQGQLALKAAKVLVIGAGGLGCPVAMNLAMAGVGQLAIADGDRVEVSNLHRQFAHHMGTVGQYKTTSLIDFLKQRGTTTELIGYRKHITYENACTMIMRYDLILDCTDNPATRYLINDACVLLEKSLLNTAAVSANGQIVRLNCPPTKQGVVDRPTAPCMRCIWPRPGEAQSCSEAGVLGPFVNMMGAMQALEATKILLAGLHKPVLALGAANSTYPLDSPERKKFRPHFVAVDSDLRAGSSSSVAPDPELARQPPRFRDMRLRERDRNCWACGANGPTNLTLAKLAAGEIDYGVLCAVPSGGDGPVGSISVTEYAAVLADSGLEPHYLLDVRSPEVFSLSHIYEAISVPFASLSREAALLQRAGKDALEDAGAKRPYLWLLDVAGARPLYVVCRTGIDSARAVPILAAMDAHYGIQGRRIVHLRGGMREWTRVVDTTMPFF